jgi:hypothetical protein
MKLPCSNPIDMRNRGVAGNCISTAYHIVKFVVLQKLCQHSIRLHIVKGLPNESGLYSSGLVSLSSARGRGDVCLVECRRSGITLILVVVGVLRLGVGGIVGAVEGDVSKPRITLRIPHERLSPRAQDVRLVSAREVVGVQGAVLVYLGISIGSGPAVPLVPAGGDVAACILVQVLAEQPGPVTGIVEAGGEVVLVVCCRLERVYATVGTVVGDDAGVVRILPAQDRSARGAACGEGGESVGKVVPFRTSCSSIFGILGSRERSASSVRMSKMFGRSLASAVSATLPPP